jgi:peptidoglycan/LPS O-acetylase OafA/YrhL
MLVLVSHWSNNIGYFFDWRPPQPFEFAGDLGVQLFFALSGFLIGRILIGIAAAQPNWANFAVFLVRRAMRTLPLYFLWLALLLYRFPPRHDQLVTALRFITLTQNLISPMPSDYYFAVSWSLTVEEWFYLLFGGALIFGSRMLGFSRALWLCLAVFILVPLGLRVIYLDWSAYSWQQSSEVFFRIDEIAYGVLMARLWIGHSRLFNHPWISLMAGVALIGATGSGHLPVPVSLVPPLMYNAVIIGCALCLPAALRLRVAPGWFSGAVSWIASRSYALYIVHLTILIDIVQIRLWVSGRVSTLTAAVLAIILPFVVAELSYRFLESPILRRRPSQQTGGGIMVATAATESGITPRPAA